MNIKDVQATIPVALQELHDQGHDRAYFDQLCLQVSLHDTDYLAKREWRRGVLNLVGIDYPTVPDHTFHPGVSKMYRSLSVLERAGVIVGEFDEPTPEVEHPRRGYRLAEPAQSAE
jgi:hypothetical protein